MKSFSSTKQAIKHGYKNANIDITTAQESLPMFWCVLISENSQRRQRVLRTGWYATIRQVQVAETLHESVRGYAKLSRWRFQSVATQVLPTFQLNGVRQPEVTPAVRSLQQSTVQ